MFHKLSGNGNFLKFIGKDSMAMFSLDDLLKVGLMLGEAVYNDSRVKKNNETEEYQEELQANIAELNKQSDEKLLTDFHEMYDDHRGQGLFMFDVGNRMDPMFMAYMEVFKERNIQSVEVCCCECDRRLGYRMVPKNFKIICDKYELTHGYCECRCGKSRRWQIDGNYCGESYITVYNF